ncbi:IS4 family transposase [Paraburkholderia hospita]|uniref:IS4 family transposase n=1 Tax=Paraburkholderia hospita TaxID=169430 RepID=UPI000B34835D|nr:IS4 family transposase [Paraburkholderia hospita]OUL95711.1 IS4 family transposase [Paraburkholderia hospita]
MARLALQRAIAPQWIDEVFAEHRQRQYPRELLFSTVVELMTLVSLAALYEKVNRTEPAILRALVQGSAQRLEPVLAALPCQPSLPGWRVRVLDGNHLPASEKRLAALREQRGAALPGHALVVYEPDLGLVTDLVAIEDAHAQERSAMAPLIECAGAGELWLADRNFCTGTILQGWHQAQACFIVREHGRNSPALASSGPWVDGERIETGQVREQRIDLKAGFVWRRIELTLDKPTEAGDTVILLWSNLPAAVGAHEIARLYRKRWRIEGMFQRLESVLHSEIRTLGHPRAALLGFTVAVLAYNVLATLKRSVEAAHAAADETGAAPPDVSTYYLAVQIRSQYEGMLIALPPNEWSHWSDATPDVITGKLLELARCVDPIQVRTRTRGPKTRKPAPYVEGAVARAHHSTARLLKRAKGGTS